jgi:hypothetical protein
MKKRSWKEEFDSTFKHTDQQISDILDKLVPLIAAEPDHGFFRGVLFLRAQQTTAASFNTFVSNLLSVNTDNFVLLNW